MALVPFSYNARSLWARGSATVMTVLSIAATVAVLAFMLALQQGFSTMFASQGRDDLAIFLRPGANSEGESAHSREDADLLIKETPEIAIGDDGLPLASAELFLAVLLPRLDGRQTNVAIRGIQQQTFAVHGERFKTIEGKRLAQGTDELMVGRSVVDRVSNCKVGDVLMLNTTPFRVVGVFETAGPHNSEIWGDADRLIEALKRPVFSRVIAQLKPGTDVAALDERMAGHDRTPSKVITERDYLSGQSGVLSVTLIGIGVFLSIVMGLAAVFTGTNAMLASITARTREIGILLSMGFRPWAIFVSFLAEAMLLGLAGGILACLVILPLNGMETGTTNFATFTEVGFAFRTTLTVLGTAIVFSLLLGLFGGAIPAWRAARLRPTQALRRA